MILKFKPWYLVRHAIAAVLLLCTLSTPGDRLTAQQGTFALAASICVVHDFNPLLADKRTPSGDPATIDGFGPLVEGFSPGDTTLYGTSPWGGLYGKGAIFSYVPASGRFQVLYSFDNAHIAEKILGPEKWPGEKYFYGTSPRGLSKGPEGDPYFYGTTREGGRFGTTATAGNLAGGGTVFKWKPGDTQPTALHTFRGTNTLGMIPPSCPAVSLCPPSERLSPQQMLDAAAAYPQSAPVLASDGKMYGVTPNSGVEYGILYRVEPSSNGMSGIKALCVGGTLPPQSDTLKIDFYAKLQSTCMFSRQTGLAPTTLIADKTAAALYGTATGGLGPPPAGTQYGTVFMADLSGRVKAIHTFDLATGAYPLGLTLSSDGQWLYGTAVKGGKYGAGVVYKMDTSGNFAGIHHLDSATDGSAPWSGLVEGVMIGPDGKPVLGQDGKTQVLDGFLYGTTTAGGLGGGTLFRMQGQPFKFELLHRFIGNQTGGNPYSALLRHSTGFIYGTTKQGGASSNNGVLYRLSGTDLKPVRNLSVTPNYQPTSQSKSYPPLKSLAVTVAGEPVEIRVTTEMQYTNPATKNTVNGVPIPPSIRIQVSNCRSPHIVQLISRERIGEDFKHIGGTFETMNLEHYDFSNERTRVWHTDTFGGKPNAYFDMNPFNPRVIDPRYPNTLSIYDGPTFANPKFFDPSSKETWRATAMDYVFCNCKLVQKVMWTREEKWIPPVGTTAGRRDMPKYTSVDFLTPSSGDLEFLNKQLIHDGYLPVP